MLKLPSDILLISACSITLPTTLQKLCLGKDLPEKSPHRPLHISSPNHGYSNYALLKPGFQNEAFFFLISWTISEVKKGNLYSSPYHINSCGKWSVFTSSDLQTYS